MAEEVISTDRAGGAFRDEGVAGSLPGVLIVDDDDAVREMLHDLIVRDRPVQRGRRGTRRPRRRRGRGPAAARRGDPRPPDARHDRPAGVARAAPMRARRGGGHALGLRGRGARAARGRGRRPCLLAEGHAPARAPRRALRRWSTRAQASSRADARAARPAFGARAVAGVARTAAAPAGLLAGSKGATNRTEAVRRTARSRPQMRRRVGRPAPAPHGIPSRMLRAMPIPRVTRLGVAGVSAVLATCALGSAPELASAAAPAPAAHSRCRTPPLVPSRRTRRSGSPPPRHRSTGRSRAWSSAAPPTACRTSRPPIRTGSGSATATRSPGTTSARSPTTYSTVNGERSRWFGPNGISDRPAAASTNLDSDLFWKQIIDSGRVERLVARRPPLGQSASGAAARARLRGRLQPLPPARRRCRRHHRSHLSRQGLGEADHRRHGEPPAAAAVDRQLERRRDPGHRPRAAAGPRPDRATGPRALAGLRARPGTGSNAIAVGRAGTRDGRHGLLLGNPHLPWHGTERFYQAHLTIPGRLDVAGASLYGVPAIQIGHTRSMAWSHTTAPGFGFTVYQLALAKDSPTAYMLDGRRVPMTSRLVRVTVRRRDGRLAQVARRLWSTRWGPVMGRSPRSRNLAWTRRAPSCSPTPRDERPGARHLARARARAVRAGRSARARAPSGHPVERHGRGRPRRARAVRRHPRRAERERPPRRTVQRASRGLPPFAVHGPRRARRLALGLPLGDRSRRGRARAARVRPGSRTCSGATT